MINKILAVIILNAFFSIVGFSQIGNKSGKYDSIITISNAIVQDLYNGNSKAILSKYSDTGFQSRNEFKNFLHKDNLKWLKHTIDVFGMTPKSELDISEWRVQSEGKTSVSINITYYFSKKGTPFSMTNDHISFSFLINDENDILLNGMMFFKKEDYVMVKNIIDNIPQN